MIRPSLPAVFANIPPSSAASGAALLANATRGELPRANASTRVLADREVYAQTVTLPDNAEIPIGGFTKAWRGLDVFVSAQQTGAASCVTIIVYAVIGGQRVRVRTGRYAIAFTPSPLGPQHVISLRSTQAERYELGLSYDDIPGGPDARAVVTAVGSNDALADGDLTVGAIPASGDGRLLSATSQRALVTPAELVGIVAVADGGAGFVQAFGTTPVGVPRLSFALPAAGSVYTFDRGLRVVRGQTGIAAALSSTPDTYTAAATGSVVAYIR